MFLVIGFVLWQKAKFSAVAHHYSSKTGLVLAIICLSLVQIKLDPMKSRSTFRVGLRSRNTFKTPKPN